MPQEVFRQSNFTNGELDPAMIGRRDLKAYYASLLGAQNLLPTPQGPIGRRPGLAIVGRLRNPMSPLATAGMTVTAPEGGDVTHALDAAGNGPVSTTAMGVVDPYVFLHIDLGAARTVSALDVVNVAVVPAGGGMAGGGYVPPPPIHAPYDFVGGGVGGVSIP